LPSAGILRITQGGGGFFKWGHPPFFMKKTRVFSKFRVCWCVRTDKGGGIQSVRTSEERGQVFAILCGLPLWTTPYRNSEIVKNENISFTFTTPKIKDVRTQGKEGLPSASILRITHGEGFFRCGRPHFLMQKTSDFSKFMVCPYGQGGRGSASADKRERVKFSRFCADFLYGRPLIVTEKLKKTKIFHSLLRRQRSYKLNFTITELDIF